MSKLTNKEIRERLREATGYSERQLKIIGKAYEEIMQEALFNAEVDDRIELPGGVGVLVVKAPHVQSKIKSKRLLVKKSKKATESLAEV